MERRAGSEKDGKERSSEAQGIRRMIGGIVLC